MSGIYLPGMEMPTGCAFCRFCEGLADTLRGTCAFCSVDGKYRDAQTNDGCPLVPVPPHGRLGDLDKLAFNVMDASTADQALAMIDDAPTVIPAEEGEG